jgi:hypothetical protein
MYLRLMYFLQPRLVLHIVDLDHVCILERHISIVVGLLFRMYFVPLNLHVLLDLCFEYIE